MQKPFAENPLIVSLSLTIDAVQNIVPDSGLIVHKMSGCKESVRAFLLPDTGADDDDAKAAETDKQ